MSPSGHIQQITAKAHQVASKQVAWSQHTNNILRCFISGDISLLVRAFLVYVRPVLEYNSVVCSVVWSPFRTKMKIEKVRRHFTKRLRSFRNLSYADRLTKFDLPSLELRHLQFDIIYCYQVVFGLVKLNFGDFFPNCPPFRILKGMSIIDMMPIERSLTVVQCTAAHRSPQKTRIYRFGNVAFGIPGSNCDICSKAAV